MSARGLPSEEKKEKQATLEMNLGPQFGTDPMDVADGRWDIRRLTNVNELEAFTIPYLVNLPAHRGGNMAKKMVYEFLNLKTSIHGWRARLIIQAIAASKGAAAYEKAKEPNWAQRNITNRGWRQQAEQEGKIAE